MKDLYTFDYSAELALETYEDVRKAYSQLFIDDMKLPILVATASSGDMGGSMSHEYHIPTAFGDDHVISCDSCDYVANEEVASSRTPEPPETGDSETCKVWRAISKDRKKFINVFYNNSEEEISTHAVKRIIPDVDTGVEDALRLWSATLTTTLHRPSLVTIFDRTVPDSVQREIIDCQPRLVPAELSEYRGRINYVRGSHVPRGMSFFRIKDGDGCPRCEGGNLTVQKAIELGHTFHLGTRYSQPMKAVVTGPKRLLLAGAAAGNSSEASPSPAASEPGAADVTTPPATEGSISPTIASEYPPNENTAVPMQMGCHGIGISRIIGAVANHFVDERGLNWPRAIAPYEVAILYNTQDEAVASDAVMVYDALSSQPQPQLDAILDDRQELSLGWKLKDGDLVGYPVIVVIGREWKASRRVEVQCRKLGFKDLMAVEDLKSCVGDLLQKL